MARRRIEEFKIGRTLGVGTVGTIYRARDLTHERDVALKILLRSVSNEPLVLARFEREMHILEKLSHPNIVRYYGGGRRDEQLFYAMELLTGGSLKDELERGGPLPVLEAATCGIQICSALQHAHNHGIIHRDLKPSNLLFTADGTLKLVDFGIARDTHAADITSEGLTVGSYAYMSPEQIRGDRSITGHVDLYSLGCLLYEMLAGRPPFRGENFAQLFEQHLRAAPTPVRMLAPRVPPQLEELIMQLLSKLPQDRPFSARAVQGALLELTHAQLQQADEHDVPAAQVIDRGKRALAQRIHHHREVSWWAVLGLVLAVVALVSAAYLLGV